MRTHVHGCGTQDCIIITAFFLFELGSMQKSLHACVCVCMCLCSIHQRPSAESGVERKEKDGGELMRKQRRIQSIPSITRTAHFKSVQCRTLAQFLKKPFENYGSALRLRNDFCGVIFGWVSRSQPDYHSTLGIKKKRMCLKMQMIPVPSQ